MNKYLIIIIIFSLSSCDSTKTPTKKNKIQIEKTTKTYIQTVHKLSLNLKSAVTMKPKQQIKVSGNINDMIHNYSLQVITSNGIIDFFDNNNQKIFRINLAHIKDSDDKSRPPRIYSIDFNKISDFLVVSEGSAGTLNLFKITATNQVLLRTGSQGFLMKKAFWVSKNEVLIALLSNEIILYNIQTKKDEYTIKISHAPFTDLVMNNNKAFVSDESGNIVIINVTDGSIQRTITGIHRDKVFQLDYKPPYILSGGQDRLVSLFNENTGEAQTMEAMFPVYAVALSPSLNYLAYALNDNNDILVVNRNNHNKLWILKGHKISVNRIIFINDHEIISSGNDETILFWELK